MTVTSASAGTLDEAYERLHATGPEFDGFLSNHGPMAAEAMGRHGHSDLVSSWLDVYMRRLEGFPRGRSSIPGGRGYCRAWGPPPRTGSSSSAILFVLCSRTVTIPAISPSWP